MALHRNIDDSSHTMLEGREYESIDNTSMPSPLWDVTMAQNDSTFLDVNNTFDLTNESILDMNVMDELNNINVHYANISDRIDNFWQLYNEVNQHRMKFNKSELVVKCLEELFDSDSALSSKLNDKCEKIFRYNTFMTKFGTDENIASFISCENQNELNPTEIQQLQNALRNKIMDKCTELKAENEVASNVVRSDSSNIHLPGSLLIEEELIIHTRVKALSNIMNECSSNVEAVKNLADDICEYREKKIRKIQKMEANALENKSVLIHLQFKNLNYLIANSLVEHYGDMSEAVNFLYNHLQNGLTKEKYSLQKVRSMKENYDKLRGTRYDDLLREYKATRENLKHKNWALKQLNGK